MILTATKSVTPSYIEGPSMAGFGGKQSPPVYHVISVVTAVCLTVTANRLFYDCCWNSMDRSMVAGEKGPCSCSSAL